MTTQVIYEWGKKFAQKFNLNTHQQVLEIGCRQGHLSAFLSKQYSQQQFTAIDNLPREIEQARDNKLKNVQFDVQDALYLPYRENFDAIISFNCLLWIQNKHLVLQNIYQALKPGGKVYLQFFAHHQKPKNDRFFFQTANEPQWRSFFPQNFQVNYHEISLLNFCQLLTQVGFVVNSLEFAPHPISFHHPEILQNWCKSWVAHTKYLPTTKQDNFLQQGIQQYLVHHHYCEQDPFIYTEYLLEVICEKPENNNDSKLKNPNHFGDFVFSPREAQILKHYLQGKSAKEMGVALSITAKTAEFHMANIKEKLHCQRRSEIFQAAIKYGFISLMYPEKK